MLPQRRGPRCTLLHPPGLNTELVGRTLFPEFFSLRRVKTNERQRVLSAKSDTVTPSPRDLALSLPQETNEHRSNRAILLESMTRG